jgi:hypothetical protein
LRRTISRAGRRRALVAAFAGLILLIPAASVQLARSAPIVGAPGKAPPYRYLIDSGPGQAQPAADGWNLLDVSSKAEADALPSGTRGLVWVGDYDNATCNWQVPDAALEQMLRGTSGDRKIAGFFFSDEPDPYACTDAPAQHRARSSLIHALDPGVFTVLVMDSNSGAASLKQIPLWVGAADYIGLDPYPCYQGRACNYAWINSIIHAADRAGIAYWGVIQAFADDTWRWPSTTEERHMLTQWRASHEAGYMTFAWHWAGHTLSSRPDLVAILKRFNRGVSLAPTRKLQSAAGRRRSTKSTTPIRDRPRWLSIGEARPNDRIRHYPALPEGCLRTHSVLASLEVPWSSRDSRTALRAMHLAHLRVDVTASALRIEGICGRPTSEGDTSCAAGNVLDQVTIPVG